MEPQCGFSSVVPLTLIPTDPSCAPRGICGTRKRSYKHKEKSKNTFPGLGAPGVDILEKQLQGTQSGICVGPCGCLEGALGHLVP